MKKKSKVLNNVTLMANFFHPIYRGLKFKDQQRNEVNNYVFELLIADALESVCLYVTSEGVFDILFKKEIKPP